MTTFAGLETDFDEDDDAIKLWLHILNSRLHSLAQDPAFPGERFQITDQRGFVVNGSAAYPLDRDQVEAFVDKLRFTPQA